MSEAGLLAENVDSVLLADLLAEVVRLPPVRCEKITDKVRKRILMELLNSSEVAKLL